MTQIEVQYPYSFIRQAQEDQTTPGEVAKRVFRVALESEHPLANPDHLFFVLEANSDDERISFFRSFRNRFTALAVARQATIDGETYGEGGPSFTYHTFDIEGNLYRPPLSAP